MNRFTELVWYLIRLDGIQQEFVPKICPVILCSSHSELVIVHMRFVMVLFDLQFSHIISVFDHVEHDRKKNCVHTFGLMKIKRIHSYVVHCIVVTFLYFSKQSFTVNFEKKCTNILDSKHKDIIYSVQIKTFLTYTARISTFNKYKEKNLYFKCFY